MSWLRSKKLDGIRGFWDGGLFRGQMTPWDQGRKATGLWTRYCKVISAPDWFLDSLPPYPLDGELWCGYNTWDETMSICTRHVPDERWHKVKYMVITIPDIAKVFGDGVVEYRIGNNKYQNRYSGIKCVGDDRPFIEKYQDLLVNLPRHANLDLVIQEEIPKTIYLKSEVEGALAKVVEAGGEGLVFQLPYARYLCERSWYTLKYKPYEDSEAVVVGTTPGEGKYSGMLGSLVVEWKGQRLCLSGMTDVQRQIAWPVGTIVAFRYRELTSDGIPKEARFKGKRND